MSTQGILTIVFWVVAILYFSWCLQRIGDKTATPNSWLAWVPVAGFYYMVQIARRPWYWFLLLFVPLVDLYVLVVLWNDIIERRRGTPSKAGVLMLVPVLNYMILTRLAFVEEPAAAGAKVAVG